MPDLNKQQETEFKDYKQKLRSVRDDALELRVTHSPVPAVPLPPTSTEEVKLSKPAQKTIEDRINEEKIRRGALENDAFEQDIALKRSTLRKLFVFLALETVVIFVFAYFQGVSFNGFVLEEWSFKLLVAATITQITVMLNIAVKHLFPEKK